MTNNIYIATSACSARWRIRRQPESKFKQWGVYCNGRLIEGGFFSHGAALDCADALRAEQRFNEGNGTPCTPSSTS